MCSPTGGSRPRSRPTESVIRCDQQRVYHFLQIGFSNEAGGALSGQVPRVCKFTLCDSLCAHQLGAILSARSVAFSCLQGFLHWVALQPTGSF